MAKGQSPPHAFSEADRLAALELSANIGLKPAARHLGISRSSLLRWRDMYPQQWSDMRAGDPEANKRNIAGRMEDLAERYGEAEIEAIDRAEKLIPAADAKETAALIKAMGSSRQTAAVTARAARGEHDAVEHNINFPQIEAAMERLLGQGGAVQPVLTVPNESEAVEA